MATAVCSEVDTGMAFFNRAVRSLSQASQPESPIDGTSPPLLSPFIPATPTNTPACHSPDEVTSSPPTALPPTNSPASNVGNEFISPTDEDTAIQFHPPDFLKLHHFHSPLLWPTAPPNSPEAFPTIGDVMGSIDEVNSCLGERLAALTLATSKNAGLSTTEMKILKEDVPKAPGE
ncbi:hypothetical protein K491DRAFT_135021 [Lophiostoma macrostomum CBS 122681]|uniref:Uncharacterized protein n=1 Tax=Lophiostoma macrostomum CBS 122681 TaxID=1314788 RepID=A0A6A6TJ57_9PLEO|nr:hypothetical protein K491DRAFT_135021 [Lophiostoma macrostomum CBS 122681]